MRGDGKEQHNHAFQVTPYRASSIISAFAQERPPQILEVYREFWKPQTSRPAGRLKWRLLRSQSISSAHIPTWDLSRSPDQTKHGFSTALPLSTELKQVGDDYQKNTVLMEELNKILMRKKPLSSAEDVNIFATLSAELESRSAVESGVRPFPGNYRDQARDLAAKSKLLIDGTAFEVDDGTLFILGAARTQQKAEARAAVAGPETRVFAVRTNWSPPAKDAK